MRTLINVELAEIAYRIPLTIRTFASPPARSTRCSAIEYRSQDAPRRLGVTPSLICRYTCGRPLGVARPDHARPAQSSMTLTNGDNFRRALRARQTRSRPTTADRIGARAVDAARRSGPRGRRVGRDRAAGLVSPALDRAVALRRSTLKLTDLHGFDAAAEYVQGKQRGQDRVDRSHRATRAPCLDYKGAYLLVDRRVTTS